MQPHGNPLITIVRNDYNDFVPFCGVGLFTSKVIVKVIQSGGNPIITINNNVKE